MKKALVIAAGALLAGVTATASAQVYYERSYSNNPYYGNRAELRAGDQCWNPRAGHFEEVRPGEVQNDLDFSRCRVGDGRNYERRAYREYRDERRGRQECWNPRAGHFEEVRQGEYQGDLDFARCRFGRY